MHEKRDLVLKEMEEIQISVLTLHLGRLQFAQLGGASKPAARPKSGEGDRAGTGGGAGVRESPFSSAQGIIQYLNICLIKISISHQIRILGFYFYTSGSKWLKNKSQVLRFVMIQLIDLEIFVFFFLFKKKKDIYIWITGDVSSILVSLGSLSLDPILDTSLKTFQNRSNLDHGS